MSRLIGVLLGSLCPVARPGQLEDHGMVELARIIHEASHDARIPLFQR